MEQLILTSKEAAILTAIQGDEAWSQELAATTRLTVSEVQKVIDHLREKRLLEPLEKQDFIRLTPVGQRACNFLKKQEASQFYSSGKLKQVVILPDRVVRRRDIASADVETLDRALDEELRKLEK